MELPVEGRIGASDRARVDEEGRVGLVGVKLVRVSRNEDVGVELASKHSEVVSVAPRNDLVTVAKPDLELAHRH